MESAASPRLSVAILARNCAGPLLVTIESVRSIASEIVVLDTGSTDDTIIASLEAGAAVHRRNWDHSFAAARNACLEKLSGDWVLWLDASETLAPEQSLALGNLSTGASPDRAYRLNVAVPPTDSLIGSEQIAGVRLHARTDGLRFAGRVRERLDESLARLNIQVELLPIVITRSPRDHEHAVKIGKAQRNIRLADLQMAEQGPTADLHNCLGEAFQALGDSAGAAQHYRRALDAAPPASREQLEAYYGLLTCLDGVSLDRSAQLALCMEALERFPLDAQLLVALGGYLQSLEHLELAMRAYDVAFRHGQIEPQIWHLPEIREIAAVCAATILQQDGRDDEARTLLEAAVRTCPHSLRLGRQLVELHVKHGRKEDALAAVAVMPAEINREACSAAVRGACLAGQANWVAARTHLQSAVQAGCRERFCFRWLVVTWLSLGQPAEAQSVLRAWRGFDAANPEIETLAAVIIEQLSQDSPTTAAHQSPAAVGPKPVRFDAAEAPAAHGVLSPAGQPAISTTARR